MKDHCVQATVRDIRWHWHHQAPTHQFYGIGIAVERMLWIYCCQCEMCASISHKSKQVLGRGNCRLVERIWLYQLAIISLPKASHKITNHSGVFQISIHSTINNQPGRRSSHNNWQLIAIKIPQTLLKNYGIVFQAPLNKLKYRKRCIAVHNQGVLK